MKHTLKFAAVFLLVTLSLISCSKDDDGPSTSGNLVGKWEYFKEGSREDGEEFLELYEHQSGCEKDNVVFSEDGTFQTSEFFGTDCFESNNLGVYTKNGTTLTTDYGFGVETATIKELNGSTLKVYYTYEDEGVTYTDISVFKRVN